MALDFITILLIPSYVPFQYWFSTQMRTTATISCQTGLAYRQQIMLSGREGRLAPSPNEHTVLSLSGNLHTKGGKCRIGV